MEKEKTSSVSIFFITFAVENRIIMELTLDLGYCQILHLISQLPANQRAIIKHEISDNSIAEKGKDEISEFQKFILAAPVMSDEQYGNFIQYREHFNQWRAQ